MELKLQITLFPFAATSTIISCYKKNKNKKIPPKRKKLLFLSSRQQNITLFHMIPYMQIDTKVMSSYPLLCLTI